MWRPEEQDIEAEEESGEGDADGGGHQQPHRVVRVVVMNAVDDEVDPVTAPELRLPVEEEAVQPVLRQGPDGEPAEEEQDYGPDRQAAIDPEPDPADHHGHEDQRRQDR